MSVAFAFGHFDSRPGIRHRRARRARRYECRSDSPTDTTLAALIGCTNVIGHKCADRLGIDIGHLEISADCTFDRRGVTFEEEIEVPFRRIELTLRSHGSASAEALNLVAREVKKFCPLSNLFTAAGTEIVEDWQPAG